MHPEKIMLSSTYFTILQMFESINKDTKNTIIARASCLFMAWEKCRNIITDESFAAELLMFMHNASRESAVIILDPSWENVTKKIKNDLIIVMRKIVCALKMSKNKQIEATKYCHFLLSLMKNPWSHHNFSKLLFGDPSPGEVSKFLQYENSNIFVLRLRMLCEGKCENQALKISSAAMRLFNSNSKIKNQFEYQDYEFIRDIHYACLERANRKKELISHLMQYSPGDDGKILMDNYCQKIQSLANLRTERRPRICKNIVLVCEMAACIMVVNSLKCSEIFDNIAGFISKWSIIMMTLMETDLRPKMDYFYIKDMIHTFIKVAPSASHLYLLSDVLYHEFGSKLPRSLYVQIYINALSKNINEKEKCKQLSDKDGSFESLKKLVQGYLKLANLLEDIVSICRECVLTAYSLMPSSDLMKRVEMLAIKSGKLIPENINNDTNVPENSCNKSKKGCTSSKPGRKRKSKVRQTYENPLSILDPYEKCYSKIHSDLSELNDPLTPIMQEDLISIIKYPRCGTFNWNLEWPRMKIVCQQYLENLDLVLKRNTLIERSDLTYLDIDIDEYNKWTEINMKQLTNDKGYFSSDNNFSDDESIASIASSGEIVSYRSKPSKSRSRKRKFGSRKRKAGSQKRRKISPKNKPKPITIQTQPKVGLRRSLRYNKSISIDETDDSTVGSLLNDEAQYKNTNTSSETEENSVDSVLEETDKATIRNDENLKEIKPQFKMTREKRTVNKNQHKDFDYSWNLRKRGKSIKNNSLLKEALENSNMNSCNRNQTKNQSTKFDFLHSNNEHLNMLSERIPQLSSLDFIVPANTDRIVNVVQIQTTSNTLTNVSQTQTERVSNHHSNNEIEKKTSENQTNTHSLDDFVSVYQSSSLNNSLNPVQNVGIHQGECSFTGSVSVSNQRITTDSVTNVQNTVQQDPSKPVGTQNAMLDQNKINTDQQHWNNIQLQNSGERLQSTIESAVHLSSNVIVRTSDVINTSHVNQTTGQITYTTKKPSTYCVKTRDRFNDLSLPASIPSVSTNNNRSTNIPLAMNTNKSNFESKIQQNTPIQTSVGLQVNFNNQVPEGGIHGIMSPNDQGTQVGTNITDNSTSTNISLSNDQIMKSASSRINNSSNVNTSFIKENSFDNLKSNIPMINPVSSIQTQTCAGLRLSNEVSHTNASVISLTIASTQSQVIKSNIHNSAYTSPHNQRIQLNDLSHTSQTNRSDEQKKIDNLKLISQTFTATSEAIKFVTSSTESQRLIQSMDKTSTSNLATFQGSSEGVSHITQENDPSSKLSTKGRGNMRTYESKTRALKQANMSDMLVFEKGTLYAVQDDIASHIEPTRSVISPRNNTSTNVKIQNRQSKECLEKPKLSPNASPNVTITGSMLPRFQQVFGKTKFPNSTVINDTSSLCSTSVASNLSSNLGPIINRPNISTSRVYSSSKGVQTNHDVDTINSNMNCIPPKVVENKLQHTTVNMSKSSNIMAIGNNKNNVIMACKAVSSANNIPQVSPSSNHQVLASNIEIKKGLAALPVSKVSTTFTTSCINSSITSSNSNLIYSIPILNDSKSNTNIEKPLPCVTQLQRQLKMSPSIIQTVLRKHPTWQQNTFRQGKQNTEVQASTIERILPVNVANIVKNTIESSNNKISISSTKPNLPETNVSTLMMEQVREFESVLEEVRKTSLMNEMSTASMLPQINHEIIQIPSPTENVDLLNSDSNQTLFPLNKKSNTNSERDRCSFSFLNQTLSNVNDLANDDKESVTIQPTIISVRSVTPTQPLTSPNNNNGSVNPVDTQCSKQIANKVKPVIKTPASSPSTSAVKVPVLQKPLPKLQEDEQTTQRIYAILDKYAEQLRNSPELKNKPAPRRRTNPPTNPSMNAKRKKTNQLNLKTCSQQTSCSSSGMEMSPTSDMQAIDSEDSSNAVSHFSHIINSPSRNSDEQSTVISETPLMENALINVNDVIKKINIEAEMKSKVSQSTQIVVSGTSGPFLSLPDGNPANVRLLVAAGNNQKMYRLHCPVTGPGPVVFHQITAKDSCSNDVKMASNIIGQNINESSILSALSADHLQNSNTNLRSEMLHNTLQNFDHKINKSNIILESMEKVQVLGKNEKQLSFPVMKKNQASQSTFSVIHTLPCKSESIDDNELLSEAQNNISESIHKDNCDNEQNTNMNQEQINNSNMNQFVNKQEKLSTALKKESPFIPPDSLDSSSLPYEDEFPSFHTHDDEEEEEEEETNENLTITNNKNNQQKSPNSDENKFENSNVNQILVDSLSENKVSNDVNDVHGVKCEDGTIIKQEHDTSDTTIEETPNILKLASPKKEEEEEEEEEDNKSNIVLDNVAATSSAEIISTVDQTSNNYKQKDELSPKAVKTECESENENENTLSNTVYNMLDNQSTSSTHTKIGSLTLRLKNDKSAKNWINCLSKIMLPGTEKMLEGDNLKQLQESFQRSKIKTFKDLKVFIFEQCKKFDNNVETPKEYDLYEDIDGLGVDKPSTNELFPEVAVLNDLDKSVSPTLGLLQASTSKSNDTNSLQARRKSVLSHTTTTTVIPAGVEQTNVVCKKNKTKVSFLKQALYNEMNQDSNDSETKPFINGIKTVLDSIEQIDSCPESPSNTNAMDSETCMSEDSTSTISSGTPHYNFRKSKRKNVEEDGFIESQVIKRMYRGRTSEDNEEKSELPKLNNIKTQTSEQKPVVEKKECNNRRISSRLKNNNVKNNQHVSNKSPQLDISPCKLTSTRTSLRRVSRKTT